VSGGDLAACAERVGFRFLDLDRFRDMHRAARAMPEWDSIEGLRGVIGRIDALSQSLRVSPAEPDAEADRPREGGFPPVELTE
jgi:hypothetical protein